MSENAEHLRILVLPFTSGSGGSVSDAFVDTITYDIMTTLPRLPNFCVTPSLTSLHYLKRHTSAIRETSDVSLILSGQIARSQETIEAKARLVDARSESENWTGSVSVQIDNIFDLAIGLTAAIATHLGINFTRPRSAGVTLDTSDKREGFHLWCRGVGLLLQEGLTPKYTSAARKLFEEAKAKTPDEYRILAWYALTVASDYLNRWGGVGVDALKLAREAKNTALGLEPNYPVTYLAAGLIRRAKGSHCEALKDFEKALGIDPCFAMACAQQANQLINLGQPQKAVAPIDVAIGQSYDDWSLGIYYWIKGRALFFMGRFTEAIPWLQKSVLNRGNLTYNRLFLISAYALTGQNQEACTALHDFCEEFPDYSLELIRRHDGDVPNENPVIVLGLAVRSIGLALAGMR
jgi:adenylate cyclase